MHPCQRTMELDRKRIEDEERKKQIELEKLKQQEERENERQRRNTEQRVSTFLLQYNQFCINQFLRPLVNMYVTGKHLFTHTEKKIPRSHLPPRRLPSQHYYLPPQMFAPTKK